MARGKKMDPQAMQKKKDNAELNSFIALLQSFLANEKTREALAVTKEMRECTFFPSFYLPLEDMSCNKLILSSFQPSSLFHLVFSALPLFIFVCIVPLVNGHAEQKKS